MRYIFLLTYSWGEVGKQEDGLHLHAITTLVLIKLLNVVSNGLVLDKKGQKMSKRLNNAIDPFETLDKFGPDATRWYMISNANPWDNLKFDIEGIAEVQRKFFGTLYNTYSFLAFMLILTNLVLKMKILFLILREPNSTNGFIRIK